MNRTPRRLGGDSFGAAAALDGMNTILVDHTPRRLGWARRVKIESCVPILQQLLDVWKKKK
jgi:hypothetical protein